MLYRGSLFHIQLFFYRSAKNVYNWNVGYTRHTATSFLYSCSMIACLEAREGVSGNLFPIIRPADCMQVYHITDEWQPDFSIRAAWLPGQWLAEAKQAVSSRLFGILIALSCTSIRYLQSDFILQVFLIRKRRRLTKHTPILLFQMFIFNFLYSLIFHLVSKITNKK